MTLCAPFGRNYLDPTVFRERPIVLRDLIALRKIRVEIVLTRKNRLVVDVEIKCESGAGSHLDDSAVHNWERAGQSETHRTCVGVCVVSKPCRAPTKYFGVCFELCVGLKPNYHFVVISHR